MRRNLSLIFAKLSIGTIVLALASGLISVSADTVNAPSLVISRFKITSSNGQFFTLYNTGQNSLDMSKYQLAYFNNYDLSKATSSRLVALSGSLPPHGYYTISDGSMTLCYQMIVDSQSLGFSSTAGMVQILGLAQSSPGQGATPVVNDFVGWSKTANTGAVTLPTNTQASLKRQPVNSTGDPQISIGGSGTWQQVLPDPNNPCGIVNAINLAQVLPSGGLVLGFSDIPASIIYVSDADTPAKSIPQSDIGLIAPQITELLPNPSGTGNDASDEFIELYNSNGTEFDLSGFVMQTGLTRLYNFSFPDGTKLKPKSFTAFYSEDTGLTLSNTSSQVSLIDPLGNRISAADKYSSAKDGQSWALSKGKWQWSTMVTPNAANVIKVPVLKKKSTSAKSKSTKGTGITKASKSGQQSPGQQAATEPTSQPVHYWALALIAIGVISYALYEYRHDLGSKLRQLRANIGFGRADRSET